MKVMSSEGGRHYSGELGRDYFAYQDLQGARLPKLELDRFDCYVGPNDVIVDFGCGAGHLLEVLRARQKLGVEINPEARRAAQARGLTVMPTTEGIETDSVDVVLSNHALEHTLCPLQELKDVHRIMRPSGTLALWVPVDDWRTQRRMRPDPNHHLYGWTPLTLGNLLEEAGFRMVETKVFTHAWPPMAEAIQTVSPRLFAAVAAAWGFARRRRELRALATA